MTFLQHRTLIEQRSHTNSASNEQESALSCLGNSETSAQRQHTIQDIAGMKLCQSTCSVANGSHQQPQLIMLAVDKMYRDGTAQECCRTVVDTNFHKLTRLHLWQSLITRQANKHIASMNLLNGTYSQIQTIFLHKQITLIRYRVAKLRISERNAKQKLKFLISFPNESKFGEAKVTKNRVSKQKEIDFFFC